MDASRIRKKKFAFSQISGYVWTWPKVSVSATVSAAIFEKILLSRHCRDKRIFSNIATDTVALTETLNKFSQRLRGLVHRCKI